MNPQVLLGVFCIVVAITITTIHHRVKKKELETKKEHIIKLTKAFRVRVDEKDKK